MTKIKLSEFKAAQKEHQIEIETDDETFVIPAPQLWDDEMVALAQFGDNLELCKALIGGADVYERFVKAGGSQSVIGTLIKDHSGVELGKSSASARR